MSHTNVEIPNFSSSVRELIRKVDLLEARLDAVTKERDGVAAEMENILRAVREWGYVDLTTEDGRDSIRLIEKPQVPV